MGADAAVERHDGTPGEDEIAARMRAEGLSPHGYEKVLYCVRGQIVFHTASGDIRLGPGDTIVLPPHRARSDGRRGGRALHRSAPPARPGARLTDPARGGCAR
jgi:mannose-6-phosphate isomerase-like protein (cupin superfamily)